MSLNYLATRFTCSWPWSIAVLLCDGRHRRAAAPTRTPSACSATRAPRRSPASGPGPWPARLRHGPERRRLDLLRRLPAEAAARDGRGAAGRDRQRRRRCPTRLYIECTAACNISCYQACCAPETGITRTRQAGMLDFDLFTRVIDEAGPSLGRIDFFNYGEAFLHKRAVEMCEYIKSRFPHIYLYTSTNGLALTPRSRRGSWCTPASTKSPSRSTAPRRRPTCSTASAATSTRRSPTCARWPTRRRERAATCRS